MFKLDDWYWDINTNLLECSRNSCSYLSELESVANCKFCRYIIKALPYFRESSKMVICENALIHGHN